MDPGHQFETASPSETEAIGRRWAQEWNPARRGWLVGLSGDLGAGKTQLVRGLALGLGYTGRISSPTYGLIHEYPTEPTRLSHLDLYRLDDAAQIIGAGLEDTLLRPEGVCVVEWIERWWPWAATLSPPADLKLQCPVRLVRIETLSETARLLRYVDLGL